MQIIRKLQITSDKLDTMQTKDKFLLTVPVNLRDLAEFSAATKILRLRTNAAAVYQYMMQKVREAKVESTEKEFAAAVEEKKKEILERSERKSKERKVSLNKTFATQVIKAKVPVAEKLNFSGKKASRKRVKNEDAINDLIDSEIAKKTNKE